MFMFMFVGELLGLGVDEGDSNGMSSSLHGDEDDSEAMGNGDGE